MEKTMKNKEKKKALFIIVIIINKENDSFALTWNVLYHLPYLGSRLNIRYYI